MKPDIDGAASNARFVPPNHLSAPTTPCHPPARLSPIVAVPDHAASSARACRRSPSLATPSHGFGAFLTGAPAVWQARRRPDIRALRSPFSTDARGGSIMATLHVVEGPVGAGKTTFAIELGRRCGAPPLVLDAWMVLLFQPDRPAEGLWPWYAERKARCMDQIWDVALGLLEHGSDAVVELGLLKRADRTNFYSKVEAAGHDCRVHILTASRDERRRRVQRRNAEKGTTFAMTIAEDVFELASDLWEPVTSAERAGRNYVDVP